MFVHYFLTTHKPAHKFVICMHGLIKQNTNMTVLSALYQSCIGTNTLKVFRNWKKQLFLWSTYNQGSWTIPISEQKLDNLYRDCGDVLPIKYETL